LQHISVIVRNGFILKERMDWHFWREVVAPLL
jgi:hypothetical protein